MTKPGRKTEPTELSLLKGNPSKKRINPNEVKPEPNMPEMPEWMEKEAKAEWKRIAPKLNKLGLLTVVDGSALAGYCQAYARWKEAEESITEKGMIFQTPSGYIQQVPQIAIAQKYLGLMANFLSRFGMTPSDRAGLIVIDEESGKTKMGKLLSHG